jgi:hypothetical protein
MGVHVSMTTSIAPAEDLSVLTGLTEITRFAGVALDGSIPTIESLLAALVTALGSDIRARAELVLDAVSREKPSVPA